MLKIKKMMFLLLMTAVFTLTLSSCGESEKYYNEIGLVDDSMNNKRESIPVPLMHNSLRLGVRYEQGYSKSKDVELFYGMAKITKYRFWGLCDEAKYYSDYDQILNLRIVRYIFPSSSSSEKEVYSTNVTLGDILTNEEYLFEKGNKAIDKLDWSCFSNIMEEKYVRVKYVAQIRTINDEYIKFICSPTYYDEALGEYVPDESHSFNPFDEFHDFKTVKKIDSFAYTFEVLFENDSFKLRYSSY